MAADFPPVPPAVIKFAEKHELTNITLDSSWTDYNLMNGYTVYIGEYPDNRGKDCILMKDEEIRLGTDEEYILIFANFSH